MYSNSYKAPARKPIPAPRLITTQPTPIAPGDISILPAEPVMFIPAIAVPVAVVMLIPLIPLMPLILLVALPFDMVMEAPIDMPLMPEAMEEPLAAAAAAAVGSLSHIIVTTLAPDAVEVADGFDVMPDCARARGAEAKTAAAKMLERILNGSLMILMIKEMYMVVKFVRSVVSPARERKWQRPGVSKGSWMVCSIAKGGALALKSVHQICDTQCADP
jgi:hypothetical protein